MTQETADVGLQKNKTKCWSNTASHAASLVQVRGLIISDGWTKTRDENKTQGSQMSGGVRSESRRRDIGGRGLG